MLLEEIKTRLRAAMKAGRTVEKEILRVAVGEIETAAAREAGLTEEGAVAIVRKLVKSNRETLEVSRSAEQTAQLEEEIRILESLLPQALGDDQIAEALRPSLDALRAAKSDGQATGIAMKALAAQGATVDGKRVAEVVKKLRA